MTDLAIAVRSHEQQTDELGALLAAITDVNERELIIQAYYALTTGDPGSFPTQFALVSKAQLRAALAAPNRIQEQLTHALAAIDSSARAAALRIETVAEIMSERAEATADRHKRILAELGKVTRTQRAVTTLFSKQGEDGLSAVADALSQLKALTEERLSQVDCVAKRASRIQASALLIALGVSFLLGILTCIVLQHLFFKA